MKMATYFGAVKLLCFWLPAATMAVVVVTQANPNATFVSQDMLPYGFAMTPLQEVNEVDPRKAITLEPVGLGTRLSKVELLDDTGKVLFEAKDQTSISLPAPLAFGRHHTIKVTAERAWFGQSESHEVNFTTVAMPKLEGPMLTMLGLDASVNLHFDRPVGEVQATGDLILKAEADATGQNIRLLASAYEQDHKYAVQLNYKTTTGVPLPPLNLELTTPPALVAETNVRGLTNLGLMLPLQVTFSEPLADRDNAMSNLQVRTNDGQAITGKWRWIGPRHLKFTPHPAWPSSSTIEVIANEQNLKSAQGGTLKQALVEQFNTGTDRKLFVYLDSQRVDAVENGKVIRTFKVSTGKSKTPTVTGSFYIYDRYRRKRMRSDVGKGKPGFYEVEDVPYTQFFHKDFAFHGAFWHNNFGQPASHGCVNMATKEQNKRWPNVSEDAGWLYQWAALGLPVTVTYETVPKPMLVSRVQTKESKSLNQEARAEMATKQELSGRVVVQR
ncbi:MAG: L,D-transpeptidase [Methylococcaceae bacterium]|nr:L,D-transpeptidase [Methylococcaceae bacterium]MDP2394886.1 L,D-transpeptidase [Methylococcaceae bacterium]MDP3019367.1 L,D-transpeptidase [Methylococcaceae bacterium]MDP3389038.1 L,D-transpeptidase [Methylococcaceae bacterium]MDZ4157524.1 L,D-transpeptidase [Methylococcales bacterium]